MIPRYIVRRLQGERRYSVWDNERNAAAVLDGRECFDLDFGAAFEIADDLNTRDMLPKEM